MSPVNDCTKMISLCVKVTCGDADCTAIRVKRGDSYLCCSVTVKSGDKESACEAPEKVV